MWYHWIGLYLNSMRQELYYSVWIKDSTVPTVISLSHCNTYVRKYVSLFCNVFFSIIKHALKGTVSPV
jgi:hypothetical protein